MRGWTLIELMAVLAVAGTLFGIAVPSFSRMLAQNHLATTSNRVLMSIVAARQTAIARNVAVTFCAGNARDGCHGDWARQQWIVFIDRNHDGRLDDDDVIRIADAQAQGDSVSISGNGPFRTAVVFRPNGLARTRGGGFAAGRLRICVMADVANNASDLVLIGSGRAEPERHDFGGACPPAGR